MRCHRAYAVLGLVLAALVLGAAPLTARADETITLDLTAPPPAAKKASAPSAPRASKPPTRRGGLRHTGPNEKVVGRLGVAVEAAVLRSGRTPSKRVLARAASGTYLALTRDAGQWYGVLMADHSTGWVLKRSVQVLNYEVVGPSQPPLRYTDGGHFDDNPLLTAGQEALLQVAYGYLGVPYKWGGTSPNGMDCSAFVKRCFAALGVGLPRTAREQYTRGIPVSQEQLRAADRLYFASRDGRITHTGIYIGDGYFIHSSSSRRGVAINRLTDPLYRKMYAGARR
ncbi:MAG: C40 family peptidase [Chthonomonadales bacterium]|nr:C40 family peptidase [Chthonomonadales bacterium]